MRCVGGGVIGELVRVELERATDEEEEEGWGWG